MKRGSYKWGTLFDGIKSISIWFILPSFFWNLIKSISSYIAWIYRFEYNPLLVEETRLSIKKYFDRWSSSCRNVRLPLSLLLSKKKNFDYLTLFLIKKFSQTDSVEQNESGLLNLSFCKYKVWLYACLKSHLKRKF